MHGEQLKTRVDNEWGEYVKENPDASHTPGDWFIFRNGKMQEWYEALDDEGKKQVEEFRQKYKGGSRDGEEGDNKNRVLQE